MAAPRSWDASTVAALDAITNKYERHGKQVILIGLNDASTTIHTRLAGNLGGGHWLRKRMARQPRGAAAPSAQVAF